MNAFEKRSVRRVRDTLFAEYLLSRQFKSESCKLLILNTYRKFCIDADAISVRERREEYDQAHSTKKKAGKKEHTG